jgi:predicted nucleic acid-binding protein
MLADMPDGCKAFIDTNIFIYHFLDLSEICTAFLERVKAREIRGFTSEVVLMEILHKLMIAEIASNYGISRLDVNPSDKETAIGHIRAEAVRDGRSGDLGVRYRGLSHDVRCGRREPNLEVRVSAHDP